jgi:hypothetical protein
MWKPVRAMFSRIVTDEISDMVDAEVAASLVMRPNIPAGDTASVASGRKTLRANIYWLAGHSCRYARQPAFSCGMK